MSVYVLKGLSPWVVQRVSAVFLALFCIYILVNVYCIEVVSYQAWMAWLFAPLNIILVGLSSIALLFHAWVGMRDVVLDYIHPVLLRILILVIFASILVACGIWITRILLMTTVN